jgi:nitrite reductase (NADH) small subunit
VSIELRRVRVCSIDDVPAGEGRVVRTADAVYALDNTCTHMGGPLADGLVADETVACPLHERRFGLATGRAVGHDCGAVAAYPTEVEGGGVYLTIPVLSRRDTDGVMIGTFTSDDVTAPPGDGERSRDADAEPQIEGRTRSEPR